MRRTFFIIYLLFTVLFTACQPTPRRTATPAPPQTVAFTPTFTPSPSPSPTRQPTDTELPVASPSPAATLCASAHGHTESQLVPGSPPGSGQVQVYLPPCFTPSPSRRYPTLYLLHGTNTDNSQWIQLGVPETADHLILSGQAPAFLVIMPREEYYTQSPGQSTYGRWIAQTLVPWVDQNYPTCVAPTCRAIGGLSRGGGWAFRVGLANWKTFGAIGMDSAVPFFGDLANSPTLIDKIPADQQPRFYIDIGKQDGSVTQAFAVVEELTKLNVTHEWHLSDGAHNRAYWRQHVEDYLRWYSAAWK